MFSRPHPASEEVSQEFLKRDIMHQFGVNLGFEAGNTEATLLLGGNPEPYKFDMFYVVLDNIPAPHNVKQHITGLFVSMSPHKQVETPDSDKYHQLCLMMPRRVIYVCDFPKEKSFSIWYHLMGTHDGEENFAVNLSYDYTGPADTTPFSNKQAAKDAFEWIYKGVVPK